METFQNYSWERMETRKHIIYFCKQTLFTKHKRITRLSYFWAPKERFDLQEPSG